MKDRKYFTKNWHSPHETNPSIMYNRHLTYKEDGYFVEIGTGSTIKNGMHSASNTGDLADIGWSGVYFDPNPNYCIEAVARHTANLKKIKIFNFGVGDKNENLFLYPGDTLMPDVSEEYDRRGWLQPQHNKFYFAENGSNIIESKIITTAEAMKMATCPAKYDILSIDVEGYELKIIKDYDFNRWRPKLVIVELRRDGHWPKHILENTSKTIDIMKNNRYEVVHYDSANTWFLCQDGEQNDLCI